MCERYGVAARIQSAERPIPRIAYNVAISSVCLCRSLCIRPKWMAYAMVRRCNRCSPENRDVWPFCIEMRAHRFGWRDVDSTHTPSLRSRGGMEWSLKHEPTYNRNFNLTRWDGTMERELQKCVPATTVALNTQSAVSISSAGNNFLDDSSDTRRVRASLLGC